MRFMRMILSIACLGLVVAGCGGSEQGPQPVQTDVEVPAEADYKFELTGAVSETVASEPGSLHQRMGETSFSLSGVAAGTNFTLRFVVEALEGDTGTFETVKTPQLTWGSDQYSSDQPLRLTIDEYGSGKISAALKGDFNKKRVDGQEQPKSISPPLTIEGRMTFSYK